MKLSEHLKLNLPIGENSVHISVLTENFKKLDDSYKYTIDKVDAVEHLIENVDFSEIEEQIEQLENKLNSHTRDNNNPHRVTKHQIGLNKVDNTADIDKPVSKPTEERLKDFWGKEELEIGGRNYKRNSDFSDGLEYWRSINETPAELYYVNESGNLELLASDINRNVDIGYELTKFQIDLPNVVSIKARGTGSIVGRWSAIHNEPRVVNSDWKVYHFKYNRRAANFILTASNGDVEVEWVKVEVGHTPTDWTPAPEDIQAQIDEVIQSVEDIPEVFHDLPQNEVKEEMTPAEFDYGVTLCSQSLITDFPSINEYGVSYTIIGKHSNYVQLFITRFGDIWSRRSSARSSWNGEWYNSKRQIDFLVKELNELSKELDTVKQSGVEINKRISDKLNLMEIEASDTDSISENVTKIEDIPNHGELTKTITTQNGKQTITPGYYEGGEVKAQFNNLTPENIKEGVNVGGVAGSLKPYVETELMGGIRFSGKYDSSGGLGLGAGDINYLIHKTHDTYYKLNKITFILESNDNFVAYGEVFLKYGSTNPEITHYRVYHSSDYEISNVRIESAGSTYFQLSMNTKGKEASYNWRTISYYVI